MPAVPLCEGLTIVTAVHQANGDYESIKTVESVDDRVVRLRYSSEQLVTDLLASDFGDVRKTTVYRSVRRADLQSARLYQQIFFAGMPESVPESTAIGTSAAVLGELKAAGRAEFAISTVYAQEISADRNVHPNLYDYQAPMQLVRAQREPVRLPVLVNDVKTELAAIHARGESNGERSEFFFLDNAENPLTLKFRVGIDAVPPPVKEHVEMCETMLATTQDAKWKQLMKAMCGGTGRSDSAVLQVVKISHRCADASATAGKPGDAPLAGSATLEQALAKSGKVDLYDIHFSFNSADIRRESEPRLAEIAMVLQRHPDWKLRVGGHTDSIGSDADNLTLSQQRAAAVKDALVKRHAIAAARLTTAGHGESQPRDDNETLQGRARNRRVELVRQ